LLFYFRFKEHTCSYILLLQVDVKAILCILPIYYFAVGVIHNTYIVFSSSNDDNSSMVSDVDIGLHRVMIIVLNEQYQPLQYWTGFLVIAYLTGLTVWSCNSTRVLPCFRDRNDRVVGLGSLVLRSTLRTWIM